MKIYGIRQKKDLGWKCPCCEAKSQRSKKLLKHRARQDGNKEKRNTDTSGAMVETHEMDEAYFLAQGTAQS